MAPVGTVFSVPLRGSYKAVSLDVVVFIRPGILFHEAACETLSQMSVTLALSEPGAGPGRNHRSVPPSVPWGSPFVPGPKAAGTPQLGARCVSTASPCDLEAAGESGQAASQAPAQRADLPPAPQLQRFGIPGSGLAAGVP